MQFRFPKCWNFLLKTVNSSNLNVKNKMDNVDLDSTKYVCPETTLS
jgi:hypothetical protein